MNFVHKINKILNTIFLGKAVIVEILVDEEVSGLLISAAHHWVPGLCIHMFVSLCVHV